MPTSRELTFDEKVEMVARVAHEANRGWQQASPHEGIPVAPAWDDFPADQQEGVINGVRLAVQGATHEELHENWIKDKVQAGWTYGPVKNAELKTHPCLVPYAELDPAQKTKDALFSAIVNALAGPLGLWSAE